jgi:IclR helix-turn-helix domain
LWAKSLRIFNAFGDHATQSIRQVAHQTGFSKSRVPRLTQAMQGREKHPESWWWETEAGRCWLIRLVVATLYTFGLKRGVGAETISEFCGRLRLETPVGGSPSALSGVLPAWEQALLETAPAWEHEGGAAGEGRPIIGAVDETFLERMMLVCMDLVRGSLLFAEVAADRTSITWDALGEARLEALGVGGGDLVSARAKALLKRAEPGRECVSIPEVLHRIPALVKSDSLAMCRPLRQARQA